MPRTPHPGRSPAQRRALDAIGCGNNSPMMAKATCEALLRDGLIVEISPMRVGTGPLACIVRRFDMPAHVHMQWCGAVDMEGYD